MDNIHFAIESNSKISIILIESIISIEKDSFRELPTFSIKENTFSKPSLEDEIEMGLDSQPYLTEDEQDKEMQMDMIANKIQFADFFRLTEIFCEYYDEINSNEYLTELYKERRLEVE